jgi:hypothetical protein
MMFALRNPILSLALAASLACAALFAWGSAQRADKAALAAENAALELVLTGCWERATSILNDKESDDAIDNLTPDDLRNIPDAWRLPVD